jgi:hypothetical protein
MLYPRPTKSNLLWVVIPVVAGISLAIVVVVVIVFRRKRSPVKQPMDSGQLMTPLMSGFEMQNASVIVPSDPVELRRMNFQTPGMLSHPPINVQVGRESSVFEPLVSGSGSISQRYGSGSFYYQAKTVIKILMSTVLRLLFYFLSLKVM